MSVVRPRTQPAYLLKYRVPEKTVPRGAGDDGGEAGAAGVAAGTAASGEGAGVVGLAASGEGAGEAASGEAAGGAASDVGGGDAASGAGDCGATGEGDATTSASVPPPGEGDGSTACSVGGDGGAASGVTVGATVACPTGCPRRVAWPPQPVTATTTNSPVTSSARLILGEPTSGRRGSVLISIHGSQQLLKVAGD